MIKDESGNRRFLGIYRGIVVDNNDPLNKGRLRLQIPQVLLEEETGWAWATHRPGIANVFIPVGTAVWVTFEGGDPSFPVWIGLATEQVTASTSYTPTFGDGATYAQSSNAATGGYIKNGKLVYFDVEFFFTNVTNFGSTQYHITLPFNAAKEAVFRNGTFHDSSASNTYHLTGHVAAGSNVMYLWYTASGQDQFFNHNSPVTIQTVDSFHLSGMYEAQ
jgi:hypothetical protein